LIECPVARMERSAIRELLTHGDNPGFHFAPSGLRVFFGGTRG